MISIALMRVDTPTSNPTTKNSNPTFPPAVFITIISAYSLRAVCTQPRRSVKAQQHLITSGLPIPDRRGRVDA